MKQTVSRHRFRRLARVQEQLLSVWHPNNRYKVIELTENQKERHGAHWAVVRTK